MPRNMSFSMTTEAVRNRTKTVTRRLGWDFLKPGDLLWAVEKGMGPKKGEKVKRIALIRVVSVSREPLWWIAALERYPQVGRRRETALEGFPDLTAAEFVGMFCNANRCEQDALVNRILFEYALEGKA